MEKSRVGERLFVHVQGCGHEAVASPLLFLGSQGFLLQLSWLEPQDPQTPQSRRERDLHGFAGPGWVVCRAAASLRTGNSESCSLLCQSLNVCLRLQSRAREDRDMRRNNKCELKL